MYSKEELEKKIEEFTNISIDFMSGHRPAEEFIELVNQLTPEDAFIFGQCYGSIIKPRVDIKTGKLIIK